MLNKKNNFNMSTTGVNLELSVFRDSYIARYNFENSFKNLYRDGYSLLNGLYSHCDVFVYLDTDNEDNLPPDFLLTDIENYDIKSASKKEIFAALVDCYYGEDTEALKYDSLNYLDKYPCHLNKNEIIELAENVLVESELIALLRKTFTAKFTVIATIGYVQGNYAEIIVPWAYWTKAPTKDQIAEMSTMIHHLFWDAPVIAELKIDDEKYAIDALFDDPYSYDKDDVLSLINKNLEHDKKDNIINWLELALPIEPDYLN